ncbi:MAG: HEAT repeat domain-containing protein [Longimicrobiales bacterium]
MRTLLGLVTLVVVGFGVGAERAEAPDEPGLVHEMAGVATGAVQLAGPADGDMARAFLDAATGANAVVCALVVQSVSNGWGGTGSMTTVVGEDTPGEAERSVLNWVRERGFDEEVLAPLADGLAHPDSCRRQVSAALFGRVDESDAVPILRPLVGATSRQTRIAAIKALGHVEAGEAAALIQGTLADEDTGVRQAGAWALGRVEDVASIAALATALQDSDSGVRGNAAWALGRIEHRDGIAPLAGALAGDTQPEVRINAAWALGRIEHADGVPALTDALSSDSDPLVRKAAAWALGQLS